MSDPKYSVIVPVYQDIEILRLFLDSLKSTLEAETELIFINDGSGDSASCLIKNTFNDFEKMHSLRIIDHSYPKGYSKALNAGLREAHGEVIFSLDSDLILTEGWQYGLASCLLEEIGIAGCVLLYPQTGGVQHCGLIFSDGIARHLFLNLPYSQVPRGVLKVQSVISGLSAMKREIVEKIGFFSEDYFNAYGDLDYHLRAIHAGYDIVVTTDVVCYHWERSNGIHRNLNRKQNLGLFWKNWGNDIRIDIWDFLFDNIEQQAPEIFDEVQMIGIDLSQFRYDADKFWHLMSMRRKSPIFVHDFSFMVGDNSIWLPQILGKDMWRLPQRLLLLVDNFCRLLDNEYWFRTRSLMRDDDLIIDLYCNVIPFKAIAGSFWPGTKVR